MLRRNHRQFNITPIPTMNSSLRYILLLALSLAVVRPGEAADLLDYFKRKPAPGATSAAPVSLNALSQDQMAQGLKEALGKGVQQAVGSLGKTDGFLKDAGVKIPMPASLQKVEKALRSLGQEKMADEFVTTMNRAAEQAVPEAAAVLGDSIKQMSIADAKAILTGTNNAATQYFRRTSQTNLFDRFHPIVKKATEATGVTRTYKQMMDKASGYSGGFGMSLLGKDTTDVDRYVTTKALDGLFVKIADEEKRIRENPLARSSDLLQKVFGAAGR